MAAAEGAGLGSRVRPHFLLRNTHRCVLLHAMFTLIFFFGEKFPRQHNFNVVLSDDLLATLMIDTFNTIESKPTTDCSESTIKTKISTDLADRHPLKPSADAIVSGASSAFQSIYRALTFLFSVYQPQFEIADRIGPAADPNEFMPPTDPRDNSIKPMPQTDPTDRPPLKPSAGGL